MARRTWLSLSLPTVFVWESKMPHQVPTPHDECNQYVLQTGTNKIKIKVPHLNFSFLRCKQRMVKLCLPHRDSVKYW